jgi:hypothetical protein
MESLIIPIAYFIIIAFIALFVFTAFGTLIETVSNSFWFTGIRKKLNI